jgi:hypothetical protein
MTILMKRHLKYEILLKNSYIEIVMKLNQKFDKII